MITLHHYINYNHYNYITITITMMVTFYSSTSLNVDVLLGSPANMPGNCPFFVLQGGGMQTG